MKNLIVKNIPEEVSRQFKISCAENNETQRASIIRLMVEEAQKPSNPPPVVKDKV
jgi:plasmid stability protein